MERNEDRKGRDGKGLSWFQRGEQLKGTQRADYGKHEMVRLCRWGKQGWNMKMWRSADQQEGILTGWMK